MSLAFTQDVRVANGPDELVRLLRTDWSGTLVVQLDGRWLLLDGSEVDELRTAAASGEDPVAALDGRPEAPVTTRASEPSERSLVFEDGRVVGAWIGDSGRPARPSRPRRRRRRGRPGKRAEETDRGDRAYYLERATPKRAEDPLEAGPVVELEPEGEAAADRTLRRTPHLDAPERIAKAPGTEFVVTVYTDTKRLREGEAGKRVEVKLPPGVDSVEVGVLLQVSPHFEVAGDQYGTLELATAKPRSNSLAFSLRVAGDAPAADAGVGVLFTYRGHSCGYVARAWDWDTDEAEAPPAESQPAAPATIPVHAESERPDLSVYVTAPINDGINYQCAVDTPLIEGYERATSSTPFAVPALGYRFLTTLLDAIVDEDKTPAKRLRALTEIGHEAFEAAPPNFARVLWDLIDAGKRPETIYIASSEPTLPWELMIPRRFDGKQPTKLAPLGTEFAIGRWTRGDSSSPPQRLPVATSFVVAPTYKKAHRQLDATAEIRFVKDRLRGTRVGPATVDELDRRFGGEHASLIHFVCHGASGQADDDAIYLDDDEELRARESETLPGFVKLFDTDNPVIFINSCSTGQMVPALSGGAGFPRSFGNLGARAVVAPLWPVDDELARDIAIGIYEAALAPGAPPVAAILRDMRKKGYEAQDVDTYAAYCFYGDPLARLTLVDAPDP
jgi:hypothetical protein